MLRTMIFFLLTASTPLAAQDFSQVKVEELATGFRGGEGPVWSREGFLIFSDYSQDRLCKYVPGKPPEVYREDSHGANGNTMDRQGRLYSCEYKARRVTRTDRKGRIEVLVDRFEGKRFNAPNDIVVRRDGHVYFTDPLYTPLDQRDLDFYGIYHVTPQGQDRGDRPAANAPQRRDAFARWKDSLCREYQRPKCPSVRSEPHRTGVQRAGRHLGTSGRSRWHSNRCQRQPLSHVARYRRVLAARTAPWQDRAARKCPESRLR